MQPEPVPAPINETNNATSTSLLKGDPGVAVAFTIAAGLATCIGGAVPFFKCVGLGNVRILAISLGLAAGVMIYLALVDLFGESVEFFEKIHSKPISYFLATVCLFCGCLFVRVIDLIVHFIEDGCKCHPIKFKLPCFGKKKNGGKALLIAPDRSDFDDNESGKRKTYIDENPITGEPVQEYEPTELLEKSKAEMLEEGKKLNELGWLAAFALALHNFPEGLATFVAALQDPKLGGALAVAIAIHNIPEGLCVAMPIYYASGSKWRAFAFASVSGVAEPLGALLGWAFLSAVFTEAAYGALFGMVSGMMLYIGIAELLPTAHSHDPKDKVVSKSAMAGAFIIACSLVAFEF